MTDESGAIDVIDAHHHIWRQRDLAWLQGTMQPRIFGPYEPIMRDYLIEEYLRDIAGLGVRQSVYVQANWPVGQFEQEARWVQQVSQQHGWPQAIVAYADFTQPDVRPDLDRLAAIEQVRGIRQQFHWHENPLYRFAVTPDMPLQPQVQRNIARLADYGWCFELQVFTSQMAAAAALARSCPAVTFVLQHAGMPEDPGEQGQAAWLAGLARLAAEPNVVSKTSGLGTFLHRNDPAHIAEIVHQTVRLFGAGRCLFGSNFPIEKLWTDYAGLLSAHRAALSSLPVTAQRAVLHDTAARIYRL
ncbi:MAG: amidohydrolase family protein [Burkholderiaceae bacterium]